LAHFQNPIIQLKNLHPQEGFDPEIYNSKNTPINKEKFFQHCAQDFVFIASSKWEDRKGWDVLLQAFTEEFTGLDQVCLAIRSTGLKGELDSLHNPNHARIIKVEKLSMSGRDFCLHGFRLSVCLSVCDLFDRLSDCLRSCVSLSHCVVFCLISF